MDEARRLAEEAAARGEAEGEVGENESSTAGAASALVGLHLGQDGVVAAQAGDAKAASSGVGEEKQEKQEEEGGTDALAHLNEEDRAAIEELIESCPKKTDYMCPISLSLLEDPVLTMDCHTYSKRFIVAHIHWCLDKGKVISSPMVRLLYLSLCVCVLCG
jgi:hypothetical protein